MIEYLTLPELLGLAQRLGTPEVRDYGLLDSALARPRTSVFGQDAYADLWHKAAALMESVARNHGLVDGNKRLAWYATWVFLHLNGYPLDPGFDVDRAERFVLAVCQGEFGVPAIAAELPSFAATP
ncbi:type II toxin-antitoxin system death-on-curing family toxin [Nocardia asteroides]|uniref:type II toxin-antitoxin system death-on-curing family toxin n=1 Tax=Nocardia asteroides TaxID=1824 RepID=UPI001E4BBC4A|nr:Fic family protein [Nocardia asteroides]UGT59696.1 Fic family protein [Nocardia asteroides]